MSVALVATIALLTLLLLIIDRHREPDCCQEASIACPLLVALGPGLLRNLLVHCSVHALLRSYLQPHSLLYWKVLPRSAQCSTD
jgi:hypothetical protein